MLEWWWLWVLIALPIGFAIAWVLTINWPIEYLPRYGFAWVIPFAFVLGLAAKTAFDALRAETRHFGHIAMTIAVGAVIAATAWSLVSDIATRSTPDWELMANEVETTVGPYTTILFHDVLSFGYNWTTFAAQGRYLDGRYRVDSTMQIARNAENLHDRGPIIFITFREPIDVPGWTRRQIDHQAWIYLPDTEMLGTDNVVDTLLFFAQYTDAWRGAGMVAAAASIVEADNSVEAGCAILAPLRDEPGLHQAVLAYAADYGQPMNWMLACAG
jgi:hypothetical protein